MAQGNVDDPRLEASQKALFDLADQLRQLPMDHASLKALFNEESELANLLRAQAGEPEYRFHEAKEAFLQAYGFDRAPCASADQFLALMRDWVDETISEYRLRV
ncbi:hypothetical protein [Defluviicoccus vanus]|uniref:Uncharacterized protein n=1 Tax=Defluviicoccus vanus TaxID=111831 RepID=A0A7H1N5D2_9PROT|nr:hypothetical protein [Defluviicoccus vanus]QNT70918.1 hypothetical protein HQ394_18375 [Defluviicoccus vanus]